MGVHRQPPPASRVTPAPRPRRGSTTSTPPQMARIAPGPSGAPREGFPWNVHGWSLCCSIRAPQWPRLVEIAAWISCRPPVSLSGHLDRLLHPLNCSPEARETVTVVSGTVVAWRIQIYHIAVYLAAKLTHQATPEQGAPQ